MAEKGTGRPRAYLLADGSRVPSVTTVLNRWKESGGLLQWAFQRGKSGAESLYEDRAPLDIGTLVHSCVEADIHGAPHPVIPPEYEERVISAYSAWRDWWNGTPFEIVATEVPLVSERHRFAGTIDAVMKTPNGLAIGDWKTSAAVYADYLLQLAAYKILWDEARPDDPITGGYHLMRFSKQHGDFEHRYFPEAADAERQFLLLLEAYRLDRELKKRVK